MNFKRRYCLNFLVFSFQWFLFYEWVNGKIAGGEDVPIFVVIVDSGG